MFLYFLLGFNQIGDNGIKGLVESLNEKKKQFEDIIKLGGESPQSKAISQREEDKKNEGKLTLLLDHNNIDNEGLRELAEFLIVFEKLTLSI